MPLLITITGPIAAGKNTVADLVAAHCHDIGRTAVIVDVDVVAGMVAGDGAAATGLWSAAHRAHGALVAGWLRSTADVVIAVGPVYDRDEQEALFGSLPAGVTPLRVLVDAPLAVTWSRACADASRGLSRQRAFHEAAHARFRSLQPDIPADLTVDSGQHSAAEIAAAVVRAAGLDGPAD